MWHDSPPPPHHHQHQPPHAQGVSARVASYCTTCFGSGTSTGRCFCRLIGVVFPRLVIDLKFWNIGKGRVVGNSCFKSGTFWDFFLYVMVKPAWTLCMTSHNLWAHDKPFTTPIRCPGQVIWPKEIPPIMLHKDQLQGTTLRLLVARERVFWKLYMCTTMLSGSSWDNNWIITLDRLLEPLPSWRPFRAWRPWKDQTGWTEMQRQILVWWHCAILAKPNMSHWFTTFAQEFILAVEIRVTSKVVQPCDFQILHFSFGFNLLLLVCP